MICACDYCGVEKHINELVEMRKIDETKIVRLCLECWLKYKAEHKE